MYILPFYHPLRLAEEICMLDQLSGGRLELGIGRGISPVEAGYYGESPDFAVSRQTFAETWKIMKDSFSQKRVTVEANTGRPRTCRSSWIRCRSRIRRSGWA